MRITLGFSRTFCARLFDIKNSLVDGAWGGGSPMDLPRPGQPVSVFAQLCNYNIRRKFRDIHRYEPDGSKR